MKPKLQSAARAFVYLSKLLRGLKMPWLLMVVLDDLLSKILGVRWLLIWRGGFHSRLFLGWFGTAYDHEKENHSQRFRFARRWHTPIVGQPRKCLMAEQVTHIMTPLVY